MANVGGSTILFGIPASPGIAIGRVYLVDRRRVKTPKQHLDPDDVEREIARFERALRDSHEQLERIKTKLKEREGEEHFQILEAHQLILHDEHLVEPTKRIIREERVNAEWALRKAVEAIKGLFDTVDDQYFRERRSDVDFVGDRIIRNLLGEEHAVFQPPPDAVVVAHDLSPADTAQLHRHAVAAFLTDAGGKTSHTAILARAFELPAVVGLDDVTQRVGNGDLVIVDGIRGEVILDPPADVVTFYRARARRYAAFEAELMLNRDLPAETKDGVRIHLHANVELVDEVDPSVKHGAEGIGLYRTEFLYMNRTDLPTEEEHLENARRVLSKMAGRLVTFRTFDLGGDKLGAITGGAFGEVNPALGLRSIRLCLKERALFKTQLRALLRASAEGNLRIMFPMISGVDELREARAVLEEARSELELEGVRHGYPPIGVMIEMPSAALTADLLAKNCDFFSIGTNDLIQYSLAIDRGNEHVSYLYRPLHPAILRLIATVVKAGHAAGIPVAMCGEMAGEPLLALVLLGFGLDELSMNPTAIPIVKSVLRSSTAEEARALAAEVLSKGTIGEVERLVWEAMSSRFPEHILKGDAPGAEI